MNSGPRDAALTEGERKIYQVAELTRLVREALENRFGAVWVQGEISNLRRPASGHLYFTLKDESAQIAAVLFRGSQRGLRFTPADGMQVRAHGDITVYERGGNYQILVRRLEEAGKGALQARFEALKEKLHAEGLFDAARKRSLPVLPQHVGVVTSETGAAIRDILNVIDRRFPNLHVVLCPVRVQGEGAATDIAAAIERLNRLPGLDVLIVGRGGGSLEDLWAFNEERVARAIAGSRVPVISAVGHEVDFTICDFVADLRAPTPSAAAELVVGRKEEFEGAVRALHAGLVRALRGTVLEARNRLLTATGRPALREPAALVRQYMQRIDTLGLRLERAVGDVVGDVRGRLADAGLRRAHALRLSRTACRQDLARWGAQLRALNPMAVLARGYSMTFDARRRVVTGAGQVRPGEPLHTRVAAGTITSTVVNVEEPADECKAIDPHQR
jgi:exodeoxyribonuclease VII large subunit